MLVFTVIFSRMARVETDLPYPLFAFTGLMAWTLTASALRSAMNSLSGNAYLVSKVAFRREALPLASVAVATVDFAVTLLMLGALMWYYHAPLRLTVLLVPVLVVVQLAFTTGLAMLLATANLWWNDVRHVFEFGITLWLFSTAVLYPVPRIDGVVGALLSANPMTPIVDAYRDLLLRGVLPSGPAIIGAIGFSVVTLFAGMAIFRRAEPRFAEIA
jgi:ABC-type polysaccharide/polyol phosphate export permease